MKNELEDAKKAKELADILNDYHQLSYFISINDEVGMQNLMNIIGEKHIIEKIIYNAGVVTYPDTVRENAINCCQFLKVILLSKGVDTKNI